MLIKILFFFSIHDFLYLFLYYRYRISLFEMESRVVLEQATRIDAMTVQIGTIVSHVSPGVGSITGVLPYAEHAAQYLAKATQNVLGHAPIQRRDIALKLCTSYAQLSLEFSLNLQKTLWGVPARQQV